MAEMLDSDDGEDNKPFTSDDNLTLEMLGAKTKTGNNNLKQSEFQKENPLANSSSVGINYDQFAAKRAAPESSMGLNDVKSVRDIQRPDYREPKCKRFEPV